MRVAVAVVVLCWTRRLVGVGLEDCDVEIVDVVGGSVGGVEGSRDSMNSVGDSVAFGVARRVLRRTETELREDCGVPAVSERVVVVPPRGLLLSMLLLVLMLLLLLPLLVLGDFALVVLSLLVGAGRRCVDEEGRVFPSDVSAVEVDLAEAHRSLRVRGLARLRAEGGRLTGGGSLSMSMASAGGGGGCRCGEAVMSSALRVDAPGEGLEPGGRSVGEDMLREAGRRYRRMGWMGVGG